MLTKDRIFWIAAAIFLLSIILAAITQNQLWLFLMVASYLLRPTLASLGIARRHVDERQMAIQHRSGNIAFAVMITAAIILCVIQYNKGDHSWELFNIVIILGLAAKALFNVLLVKNYREAGIRIIMAVGMLVVLFVSVENGFSTHTIIESSPGLVIIAIGWIARKYPKPVSILLFTVTAALLVIILGKGFTIGQITTALLVGVPLILAGTCLLLPDPGDDDTIQQPNH